MNLITLGQVSLQTATPSLMLEPLPASNMLDLIPAIIIGALSVIFLFLALRLSRIRADGVGSIYLLMGVFLFLACFFQVIFLFLRSEWLYTFIFVQEVFLLLTLVTLIISALTLSKKQAHRLPPLKPGEEEKPVSPKKEEPVIELEKQKNIQESGRNPEVK